MPPSQLLLRLYSSRVLAKKSIPFCPEPSRPAVGLQLVSPMPARRGASFRLPPPRESPAAVRAGSWVGAGCLHSQIPAATAGCVSSRVILPEDVLFTFSFIQQLSVLVPGFVLGGGRICGYKTFTEASFRSERGSLCAGRYFALCSKFPFEKCQIILVNTVENPPALGLRQQQKQRRAGCREAAQQGGFFHFGCTNRSAAFPLLQSKAFL